MNKKVSDFYDEFSNFQKSIAFNERHYHMLDKLLELGLKSKSKVLELGCGIGIITALVNKVVKKGMIVSVDISPKSVEIAKHRLPDVEFYVGDITSFKKTELSYDFITLFDVLEHIPLEMHSALFENLAAHMSDHTKLLINIPNPDFLDYLREEKPESLQIIDNSLEISEIVKVASIHGFDLVFFEKYDLWHKYESEFMIFELKNFNAEKATPPKQSLKRRIQNRLEIY